MSRTELYRVNLNVDILATSPKEAEDIAVSVYEGVAESTGQAKAEISEDSGEYWRLKEQNDPDFALRNR